MNQPSYYLGCPIWACEGWLGNLFTAKAKRRDWLRQYSQVFNTVEGNSTFYGLPGLDAVRRWVDETPEGFRFVLKFPKAISHEHELVGAERETDAFLEILQVLHESNRLGPSFLQLSPYFKPQQFAVLEKYLRGLPHDFPYAVEVRHHDFFDRGKAETELDSLLTELEIDKVIFDSRPLYSAPPTTESETKSQTRKPKTPIRRTVTGRRPVIRIVGRDDVDVARSWLEEWAPIVAGWIADGLTPFVFTHAPNDYYAPQLGRAFHDALRQNIGQIEPMAAWSGEHEAASTAKQLELF